MIVDQLHRLSMYGPISTELVAAARWVAQTNLHALPLGKHAIDGDRIFAIAMEYPTKPDALAIWEVHRRYIDVQIMLAGTERMCVADLSRMAVTTPYDTDKDAEFLAGSGDWLTLSAGQFAIFFPHDAHRPSVQAGDSADVVRKIVIKVQVEAQAD